MALQLVGHMGHMELQAQPPGVFGGGLLPAQTHVQVEGGHLIAGLAQTQCGHGGVHPAGQAQHHPFRHFSTSWIVPALRRHLIYLT